MKMFQLFAPTDIKDGSINCKFWREVAKIRKPGECVAVPDEIPDNSIDGHIAPVRAALGVPIHHIRIDGKRYVVCVK